MAGPYPCRAVGYGMAEHTPRELRDQSHGLGHRDEAVRADDPPSWMVPACQSLEAAWTSVRQADLRLIRNRDLVPVDGPSERIGPLIDLKLPMGFEDRAER